MLKKSLLHLLLLLPLAELVWQIALLYQGLENRLGADPGKVILEDLGIVAIWILLATLALTPLKKILQLKTLIRYRRMIGLYAFFYMTLHIWAYLAFLLAFQWQDFFNEIAKRPYILVGMLAWVACLLLALTSFQFAMKKLGRNWQRLHRGIYLIALLAVLHELWQAKSAYGEPALHGFILSLLLGYRVFVWLKAYRHKRFRNVV